MVVWLQFMPYALRFLTRVAKITKTTVARLQELLATKINGGPISYKLA